MLARTGGSYRAGSWADIYMDDADEFGAYAQHLRMTGTTIQFATVNIPSSRHDAPGEGYASYEYQIYLHEIGHALGLGHAGNYNGSARFGVDNTTAMTAGKRR